VIIDEIHHAMKLDAPSGTAITLAEGILAENPAKKLWKNDEQVSAEELSIRSLREGDVPGIHEIIYTSEVVDCISIKHETKNRKGLALGAVLAAEFMKQKSGFYGMNDLLKIS